VRALAAICLALAACWVGPAPEAPRAQAPQRVLKRRPQCWSHDFYKMWPRALTDEDIQPCYENNYDPADIWSCRYIVLSKHYDLLWAWNMRWFDICGEEPRSDYHH
jgi:hypothetical protein